ncbi:DNA repair protein RadC [Candidatus Nomurabacteria bacterium]|uniref:DNA repair protein RadC n=1 Tax=Candidatus Dojkabacteria bacterium TaxID=2099670 RepID=A0A955I1F8_9BACT|nr:DNA repair protein RadC [Candidatus Dojkabacteria bacterium]MCB9789761.1 DNA repair protein RadC [Candidatus Nomurabacteria bacterium]MCB9803858.1 DNA repair protein RadC [Candidatus Nomurabacteria bacterium]
MRPREKMTQRGVESLSVIDLLSLIVGSGTSKQNYQQIAKKITEILKKQDLEDLQGTFDEILQIKGIGASKACAIVASLEIGRRLYDPSLKQRKKVTTSSQAAELFNDIREKRNEVLQCVFLNARYESLRCETVSIGSIDQVGIHPREIISRALELNAYGIIICHNHPSGDHSPSVSDRQATQRLNKACELIGIKLIDHIIVSKNGWTSIL